MDRFQKFRKILASVNMIIIAAVFITCAVYTVNVLAEEDLGGVELVYEGFPYSEPGQASTKQNPLLAPGYYYTTSVAIVENRGTEVALAELLIPEIYLTRDKNNNPLPERQLAPPGYVTIDVEILTASAIDGTPLNTYYINNYYDYRAMAGISGYITHYKIYDKSDPSQKAIRHFFEFDKARVEPKLDSNGDPVLDNNGDPVYEREPVRLTLKITIDLATRAAEMTNEWNKAELDNFGFKLYTAEQARNLLQTLKLSPDDYAQWYGETRSIRLMPF